MITTKEYIGGKQEKINQGRLVEELIRHDGYKMLMKRLTKITDEAKEQIIHSQSHEEFIERRSRWGGLLSLAKEVATFINRGKSARKTLKI